MAIEDVEDVVADVGKFGLDFDAVFLRDVNEVEGEVGEGWVRKP